MKQILLYAGCFLLFSAAACTVGETETRGSAETVDMALSTRGLDPAVPLRMVVADAADGTVIFNRYLTQADLAGDDYTIKLRAGRYRFYLLGNEPARLTPALRNTTNYSQLSPLDIHAGELPASEAPEDSQVKTNIPVAGTATCIVRVSAQDAGKGEVSTDNGVTWSNRLSMELDRLAVKVALTLRKRTPVATDRVVVRKIEILNTPGYSYVQEEKTYDGTEFNTSEAWSDPPGIEIEENPSILSPVFSNVILPEYVMENAAIKEKAVTIRIHALYNGKNVLYYIPVRRKLTEEDYSLPRNNHFMIVATITTAGESLYLPEVNYRVADWTEATDNPTFIEESAIQFEAHWESGTNVDIPGRKVYLPNNAYVDYYFTLNYPLNATWAATITNPVDFMFDESGGAVSGGRAKQGEVYKIRIRPRRVISENDIKTEFFITVNTGLGNVELNLPSSQVGTGNRFTILQIPN